ncbi:A disintegrin and metalloproteinase with thrombospondin motifs adt-2-like isoform X2 [Linepithema humile]|uniref:A disintegrin and metalloproteinase with thrombospondin motifs adt-2-like isoform X2 n=1 Tax=Linepithema humile TaxID=83485 RepID=UPI00062364BE|nr:PREDICTED: A disintegrin and metalloproteinase with thrombospondin motifs 2-like isoform X2 [Linepithema humile]
MYIIRNLIYKKTLIKHFQVLKFKNARNNMILILKLVLIFLLNKTHAYIEQDIERILLPALNSTSAKEIPLTLKIFEKQIQLNLRRNDQIVSSKFKVWKHDAKSITEELIPQLYASDPCHYFHNDHISTAAINFCQEYGWEGFVFLKDETLEIRPLRDDFASLTSIDDLCVKEETNISIGKPHLIKRTMHLSADSSFRKYDNFKIKRRHVRNTQKKLTIELAVFVDEAAYRTFMPFLDKDEKKLRMMILAYVNNIQAMFHHPSLGVSIDISLVHLEFLDKQPSNLPDFGGDVVKLSEAFCEFAKTRNPPDDNDPHHWDIGLYITGVNVYGTSQAVAGKSFISGVCKSNKSCAIVEFGIVGSVTSGFISSLAAAHEIGHVLGMQHDSIPCEKFKYIMTPGLGPVGHMTWSECSRNTAEKLWTTPKCLADHTTSKDDLDHSRYHDLPGREWTAKAQCEIYFRDKDANVVSLLDICKSLQCESPHKNGYYFTGPALEGTYCVLGKECRGGECVPLLELPYTLEYCEDDNWCEWKEGTCQSSCLEESKGVKIKRRSCKHGSRRTASCEGPYYDVVLCDDSLLCTEKQMKPGWQAAHDVEKPWKACTVHCRLKDSFTLYSLRVEMIGINMDPYFPDGMWCHKEHGEDYYCRQHYCLPESYNY